MKSDKQHRLFFLRRGWETNGELGEKERFRNMRHYFLEAREWVTREKAYDLMRESRAFIDRISGSQAESQDDF